MNIKNIDHLIQEIDKPDHGIWILRDGEVARWDDSILAWRVTGDSGFEPNWRKVVGNHGHFDYALSLEDSER